MSKLLKNFFAKNANSKIWAPLNNVSLLLWQWNEVSHFRFFKDKTPTNHFVFIDNKKSFGIFTYDKFLNVSKEFFGAFFYNSKILKDKEKFFFDTISEIEKDYFKFTSEFIKNKSDKFLIDNLLRISKRCWSLNGSVIFAVYPVEADFFYKDVNIGIKQVEIEKIWEKATTPTHLSFEKQQLIHYLNLVINKKSWEEIISSCQYFYASFNSVSNLKTVETKLKDDYKKYNNIKVARAELLRLKKESSENLKKYNKWYREINFKHRKILEYLQAVIKFRDIRKSYFSMSFVVMWKIAQELFSRTNLNKKYLSFILPEEFKSGTYKTKNFEKVLEKRSKGICLLVTYGKKKLLKYCNYKIVKKISDSFYSKYSKNFNLEESIISGKIGSPGKVRGIVRKALYINNKITFKKGEILVTSMTRTEFMPLMKIAKAVITDEGGITCHAAIISRELKIPCIIGTNIATKVLKDGDFVEVDADQGIVRILNK